MVNGQRNPNDSPSTVKGVGETYSADLKAAGYETIEDLQRASKEELADSVPLRVSNQIKEQVGNRVQAVTSAAQAREMAQKQPGAVAKVVKRPDGTQDAKVLQKEQEQKLPGATVEVHKG